MSDNAQLTGLCDRFRGFYPVVIDVETAGFNAKTDALLEIAAITLKMDELTDDERTIILKGCLINYYRDSSEE